MDGRCENPKLAAKTARSRAWSPIAIAGRGSFDFGVEMMPKGMLAREKCDLGGIGNHDFRDIAKPFS